MCKCFHAVTRVSKVFESKNLPLKAVFVHSSEHQHRVEIVKVKSLGANVAARVWDGGSRGLCVLPIRQVFYGGQTDEVSRASCHWVQSNDWPSLPLPNPLIVLSMFGCGHSLTLWGVRITLSPSLAVTVCVCACVRARVFRILFPIYIDSQ